MATTVTVSGARQLRAALRASGLSVKELSAVHRKVGELVANRARARAPKRSGRLTGSIRPGATSTAAIVRAGRAAVPYAGVIHYGWPRRNIEANPYLSSVIPPSMPSITRTYENEIQRVLDLLTTATGS